MPGLIRSQEENDRINARVKTAFPALDVRKIAAYEIGDHHFWIYPLTSLKERERSALKAAGYEYYGRNWAYVENVTRGPTVWAQATLKCSICGNEKYTKGGNTAGGRWVFVCDNGHRWSAGNTLDPFPWREDDPQRQR